MPVGAVILVRLRTLPNGGDLNRWRRDLLTQFEPNDFRHEGPLRIMRVGDGAPLLDGRNVWLDVGTTQNYYEEGYERGNPEYLTGLAEWLELHIPQSELWYGHDGADESIQPFEAARREALLDYYRKVGHDPYRAKFR